MMYNYNAVCCIIDVHIYIFPNTDNKYISFGFSSKLSRFKKNIIFGFSFGFHTLHNIK